MTDVDRLLREFKEEHERGGATDPQPYLARVSGRARFVLAEMIERHLAAAPRRAWDETEFAASGAASMVEGIERSLGGEAGTWPVLLPRLRNRAKISREELTARLADALGVGNRQEKVHAYYHQMERGTLPAEGVSQRVLDALARLVGESADTLRRAGPGSTGEGDPVVRAVTYARSVKASRAPSDAADAEPAEAQRTGADEWDEVDEMFRHGS